MINIIESINNDLNKLNPMDYFSFSNISNTITSHNRDVALEKIISFFISYKILSFRLVDTISGDSPEGYLSQGSHIIVDIIFQEKIIYSETKINSKANVLKYDLYHSVAVPIPKSIDGTSTYTLLNINRIKPVVHIYGVSNIHLDTYSLYNTIYSIVELQYIPTFQLCYGTFDYLKISKIFTSFKDGTHYTLVEDFKFTKINHLKWSPKGDIIAYCKLINQCNILCINNLKASLKSNRELVLCKNICEFSWGDNNSILYTSSLENKNNIYSLNIKNNAITKLTFNMPGTICSKLLCYDTEVNSTKKIMFIRDTSSSKLLYEMDFNGLNLNVVCNLKNIYDYTLSHDKFFIACLTNEYNEGMTKDEGTLLMELHNIEPLWKLVIFDRLTEKSMEVTIPNSPSKISKIIHKPFDTKFIFIASFKLKDDIYSFDYMSNSLLNLTENADNFLISDITISNTGHILYYSSNELGYYNIFSYNFNTQGKNHIVSTNSLDVKLEYRPSL